MAKSEIEYHFSVNKLTGVTSLSEKDLIGFIPKSGGPWQLVFESILMPEKLKGLRILDVGAGAADAVDRLLELGADAYAIDPAYRSRSELKGQVKKNISASHKGVHGIGRIKTLERFMRSINENPDRYITGTALSMSFPDNYFDIVYSRTAILGYLDLDSRFLDTAIQECIRVTKPGGTIRLFPFMDFNDTQSTMINEVRFANTRRMVKALRNSDKIESVEIVDVIADGVPGQTLLLQKSQ